MRNVGLVSVQRPALAQAEDSSQPQTTFGHVGFSSACPARCWRRRNRKMLVHCQRGKDDKARLACSSAKVGVSKTLGEVRH